MVAKLVKDCEILPVLTVKLEDDAVTIAKKLHDFQERRIFVLNDKKAPVGIISIVDINDRVVARGKDPKKTKAKEIMTYPINLVIDVNDSLEEVMKKMIQTDNYYVPVTHKGILLGLLTYANIMKVFKK
ncbi:MAG: CBS domain-containing protein [Candidatus Diapherotrites archaeon]